MTHLCFCTEILTIYLSIYQKQQEGQRCLERQVAQAAVRLSPAVIKFRNKERNVRTSS